MAVIILHWLMIEFKGFLISWEMVELMRLSSSPSALEVSYRIFWEISEKQSITWSYSLLPETSLIKLLLKVKNLNLGINSSSMPLMHLRFAMT